ncbi:MAG: Membrane alanine aminopeptidase N, partial [uncultured Gemmatimonadetes bacterium]
MQPGVSLELARHRAATIAKVQYDLALDVTGRDRAPGTLTLRFERGANAGDLVVDFRGPVLDSVSANGAPVTDYTWEQGHILVPARHLRIGANTLSFRFAAAIAPAGASIIRYDDSTDSTRYLYTLLVPADANQLFPSFDQPDLKGVFRTEIVAPAGWRVLANGPVADSAPVPGGVRWRFAPTEPISTYLAAFAAGPWKIHGDSAMRLYARASVAPRVDADTLIRINREAARWLEGYFAMQFPFAKMDALLAPAFPFGGMEHVGA